MLFQRVGPGQAWIATSRRGWVIAAWVLACRARFADSSVKTARDGLSDRHPRSPLHLDDSGYLGVLSTPIRTQWKGPPAGRKFDTFERWLVDLPLPTGCSGSRSNLGSGTFLTSHICPRPEAASTAGRLLEASSTDFALRSANGADLNTLQTWTRTGSARPRSW